VAVALTDGGWTPWTTQVADAPTRAVVPQFAEPPPVMLHEIEPVAGFVVPVTLAENVIVEPVEAAVTFLVDQAAGPLSLVCWFTTAVSLRVVGAAAAGALKTVREPPARASVAAPSAPSRPSVRARLLVLFASIRRYSRVEKLLTIFLPF
jgi:hypothetical protein